MDARTCQAMAQWLFNFFFPAAHHSCQIPSMADRPMVPSETRKRQKEARDKLACEINDAVDVFMKTLDNLADKHGQCVTLLPFGNIASLTPNFLHSKRS